MIRGHGRRQPPKKLARKLKATRAALGCSQQEMAKRLREQAKGSPVYPGRISKFEAGRREPSLLVLLVFARLGGISTDVLIDGTLDLLK
jgi:transcriptional regulator with XRE-family HTH domain